MNTRLKVCVVKYLRTFVRRYEGVYVVFMLLQLHVLVVVRVVVL